MHPELRVYLQQQMHVVGHHLHLEKLAPAFGAYLVQYLPQPIRHRPHQHRTAVLGAEDNVVLGRVHDVFVLLVLNGVALHCDYYTAKSYLRPRSALSERKPLTPCLKAGACAAYSVTAFVALGWWPNNPGHVLVVPNPRYENLYDLPLEYGAAVHAASREVALAMKAVHGCHGVSTRQHNEPAGFQEVWHYHLHVFPRWEGDDLYLLSPYRRDTTLEERLPYARKLREFLSRKR